MSRGSLGGSGITTCPLAPISLMRPPLNSTSKLPPDNTFVELIDVGVTSSKDTWRRTCERGTDNMNGDGSNENQLDNSNEDGDNF